MRGRGTGRGAGRGAGAVALAAVMLAVVGAAVGVGSAPAGAATPGNPSTGFVPVGPFRIADTRTSPTGARLAPGVPLTVTPSPVPVGTTRVAVVVTATAATGAGELRVHPCGAYDPTGLVLVAPAIEVDDSALAFVSLTGGAFCVSVTAPTHVVVDLRGYELAGGGSAFAATGPTPLLTRARIAGGATLAVPVVGVAGTPADTTAVSLELVALGEAAGFLTVWQCDQPRPLASVLTYPAGRAWTTAALAPVGPSGTVCVYAHTTAEVTVTLHGHWSPSATATATGPFQYAFRAVDRPGFVAVAPTRLFDTRGAGGPVTGGQSYRLDLGGTVPDGATDAVMNVTVTEPVAAGFVSVYPCDAGLPVVSNLNFRAGQTVPNLVTTAIDDDGAVCLYTNVTAHLLADLAGWYEVEAGDGYVPVDPTRLFDTRAGTRPAAGFTYELDLAGVVGADASAVVLNVTVTETGAAGFVTAYPCSSPRPNASNLNYVAGQTVPNLVTVAVGADRKVCLFTSAPAHLLADLAGWYGSSSSFRYVGLVPERLFDTRDSSPVEAGRTGFYTYGPGVTGAERDEVVAVVLNVTAVEPEAAGFVAVHPCAAGRPLVSNVNYVAGEVVPNLAIVRVDADDDVCFFSLATTDLVVDAAGYFTELQGLRRVSLR